MSIFKCYCLFSWDHRSTFGWIHSFFNTRRGYRV